MRAHRLVAVVLTLAMSALAGAPAAAGPGDPADEAERVKRHEADLKRLRDARVTLEVNDMPLVNVLAQLQRDTGIKLMLDPAVRGADFDSLLVSLNYENGSLEEVLADACSPYDLALSWDDGVFVVTLAERAEPRDLSIAMIDVRRVLGGWRRTAPRLVTEDIAFDAISGDTICDLVFRLIAPGTWEDPYCLDYRSGNLIVRHDAAVIAQVRELVAALTRWMERRAQIELRVYRATPGTGASLGAGAIVPESGRADLFKGLEAATLLHTFRTSLEDDESVELRDVTVTDVAGDRDAVAADSAAVLAPVVTPRETGVTASIGVTIDGNRKACLTTLLVSATHARTTREIAVGAAPGATLTLSTTSECEIQATTLIPDGGTLVVWNGDSASGSEIIATLSVAIHNEVPRFTPPPKAAGDAAVAAALAKPITLSMETASAVDFFEAFAAATGLAVTIDESLEWTGSAIDIAAEGIPASTVLRWAIRYWEGGNSVAWMVEGNGIWAGSSAARNARVPLELHLHDVGVTPSWWTRDFPTPTIRFNDDDSGEATDHTTSARSVDRVPPNQVVDLVTSMFSQHRPERLRVEGLAGALVVLAPPDLHAEVAALLTSIDRLATATVDVELLEPGRAAYARVFPAGSPRKSAILTPEELAALRADRPTRLGTARIAAVSGRTTDAHSMRRHEHVSGLLAQVASHIAVLDPEIGAAEGGMRLRIRANVSEDGTVQVHVRGALARVISDGSGRRTADGVECAEVHELAIDVREAVKSGETFAAVIGGPRPGESAPVVLLVTPTPLSPR